MEVNNIFMTNSYNMQENERVTIIFNLLGREVIHFGQILK